LIGFKMTKKSINETDLLLLKKIVTKKVYSLLSIVLSHIKS